MSRFAEPGMINDDGEVFMPGDLATAQRLHAEHGARPAGPDFPWPCTSTAFWGQPRLLGLATRQCILVDGHAGPHEGRVSW